MPYTKTRVARYIGVAVLTILGSLAAARLGVPVPEAALPAAQPTDLDDADERALLDFHARVERYADLHRMLEQPLPPLVVGEPQKIQAAQQALAREIRAARANAGQGELFTPGVARAFRRLIDRAIATGGHDAIELLSVIDEENPHAALFRPRVNMEFPDAAPPGMMPPRILQALPGLPEELEYRFVNRYLLLWDPHADLIVDFLPDAISIGGSEATGRAPGI